MPEKFDEGVFQEWYKMWSGRLDLNPDPDDPRHKYDYRAAYVAGAEPQPNFDDGKFHWPSQFKADDHPNRFVDGMDTKTGEPQKGTDEFGGIVEETDEFGGTIFNPPPSGQKFEKPIPLGSRLIDKYYRPTAQALGSVAGIIFGSGTGATAGTAIAPGPGTATGAILGAVAGEALGYAIGDETADILQEWFGYYQPVPILMNLQEAGENVREGATYAMGGYNLGPAAKLTGKGAKGIPGVGRVWDWASSMFPKTKKGAQEAAGEVLAAFTAKGPMVVDNMEKAKALEELIGGGFKFDLGQLTGDINVVKFMKESLKDAGDLAVAQAKQSAINTKAINAFIKRTKGKGTTRDFLKPLSSKKELLAESEAMAKSNLEKQQLARGGQIAPMEGGAAIRSEVMAGEQAAIEEGGKKFKAVPEQNQIVDDLYDEFRKIMKPKHKAEGSDKFPKVLQRGIKIMKDSIKGGKRDATSQAVDIADSKKYSAKQARAKHDVYVKKADVLLKAGKHDEAMEIAMEGQKWRETAEIMEGTWKGDPAAARASRTAGEPTMSLRDIQGLRSEILEDLRTAKDKGLPKSLRARLAKAVEIIDKKLGTSSGKEGKELQVAQKWWRENVAEKYGKGSVGDILRGEESVQDAMVAGKFFKTGPAGEQAATEFMNIMGDNAAAKTALREHINQKVYDLRSDKTGEITRAALNRFLKIHKPALKKLGMTDEFNTLMKARVAADKALAVSKEFEKSVASRVLNGDVNDIVKNAFSGTGSKKKAAEELIAFMKRPKPSRDELLYHATYNTIPGGKLKSGFFGGKYQLEGGMLEGYGDNLYALKPPKGKYVDPKAIAGLQNAMVDEILTKIPLDKPIRDLLTSTKMAAQFREYDAALKVVFKDSPEKLKAMHTVRRAIKALEYKTGETAGEGERYAADVVRRIAFLQGHSTVAAVDIARKTVRLLKGMSKEKIHKFINRGILDPEVAYSLMQAARGGSEKRMTQGIVNSLVRLGLIAQPKKQEIDQWFTTRKGKH